MVSFTTLLQPSKGFRYGIDSFLLARFAEFRPGETVCDLGAGSGILGLLALKRGQVARVLSVEVQVDVMVMARQNALAMGCGETMEFWEGDWRDLAAQKRRPRFDLVISNPPYRKSETCRPSPRPERNLARQEVLGGLDDLVKSAVALLKPTGRFCVMYPPIRLEELLQAFQRWGLKARRMVAIHPYLDRPATQVLVEAVRSPHRELRIDPPLVVYRDAEHYQPEIEAYVGPKRRKDLGSLLEVSGVIDRV